LLLAEGAHLVGELVRPPWSRLGRHQRRRAPRSSRRRVTAHGDRPGC
jgi:hypothetical protein